MAPLKHSYKIKVRLPYLFLIFLTSTFISPYSLSGDSEIRVVESQHQYKSKRFVIRRMLLELNEEEEEDKPTIIKKNSNFTKISTKNHTKLIKPTSNSSKNQTKTIKLPTSNSPSNKTKLIKTMSQDSMKNSPKSQIKNTTKSSPTKSTPLLTNKSQDLTSPKNKTTKSKLEKGEIKSKKAENHWIDEEDEYDLVADFRDLPSKFQQTFIPDLEKISKTSKSYLNQYNKEFTKGFKPYIGTKYASTTASIASFTFIIIPLILVSLIFNKIKAYFSLQKLLIFIQIYLAIYFTILCLSSLVTGLEPLKFFYSTSQSTYVCAQVLQTVGYVLYLLMLLMYFVFVFSTKTGFAMKILGLGQTIVGFAVGLHYYMTVVHRAVLHQPPRSSWKVHGLYATCFVVICLLGRVDGRKKAYMEDGGDEGKKS